MKVLHCITSLHPDGAQRALLRLLPGLAAQGVSSTVLSLTDHLALNDLFQQEDVNVHTLSFNRPGKLFQSLRRFRARVTEYRPDLIQGWMYHGNLAATLAGRVHPAARVCWNIRTSIAGPTETKMTTRCLRGLCALLSRNPDCIVYCAGESRERHHEIGFHGRREEVIPNGFDTEKFRPSLDNRRAFRAALQLPPDAFLIGTAGRFHPTKDPATLLAAAVKVLEWNPRVHFVLIGSAMTPQNTSLAAMLPREESLRERVHLLGPQTELQSILPAFSAYCSSSALEGFPNAIAEAMACGVPVVATDAGGSSELLGGCGLLVPAREPDALANALAEMALASPERLLQLGVSARTRVSERFSLDAMIGRYLTLYRNLCDEVSTQRERESPAKDRAVAA